MVIPINHPLLQEMILLHEIKKLTKNLHVPLHFIHFILHSFLWFFMESILARGDNYNFLRKLAENIKQTKDANDETENSSKVRVLSLVFIGNSLFINVNKAF